MFSNNYYLPKMLKLKDWMFFAYLLLLVASFVACNRSEGRSADVGNSQVDSFLNKCRNGIPLDVGRIKKSAFAFRESIKDSVDFYRISAFLGNCFYLENKVDSAMAISKEVVRFCQRNPLMNGAGELGRDTYNDLGVYYQALDQRDSAISYLNKAVSWAASAQKSNKLIDIYINLADNYDQSSKFIPATDYYRRAMLLADSLGLQKKYAASTNTGLAKIYTEIKNFKLADSYYRKVEKIAESLPLYERFNLSNSRGNYYYTTKEYPLALKWFNKANGLALKLQQPLYEAIVEANIGEINLLMDRNDSAKHYLDKAARVLLAPGGSPAAAFYLNGLYASYYLQTKQAAQAEKLLSMHYDTASISPTYLYFHDKRLEKLYIQKGNYQNAYLYSNKARDFDDSLSNVAVRNNMEELNFRYSQDTALLKKNILIRQKEQKLAELSNSLIILLLVFIIAVLMVCFVIINLKKRHELDYSKQIGIITKLRMENVRNQISPHFIFNVLNSMVPDLKEHSVLNKSVESLIQSIRGNLVASEKIAISIEEEVKNVKNYLGLLENLQNKLPKVLWEIADEVDLNIPILSMCIQIPVENAVKYAFEDRREEDFLEIKILREGKNIKILIVDNGVGFDPSRHANSLRGTGNGLKILYKTIDLLNKKNTDKVEFDIQNNRAMDVNSSGTKVMIKIPIGFNFHYE